MSSGNFPVWHDSPEADKLRQAIAIIEEVSDWGYEHIDDSGRRRFDYAPGDILDSGVHFTISGTIWPTR